MSNNAWSINTNNNSWAPVESKEAYGALYREYLAKSELELAKDNILYSIYGYIPYKPGVYLPYLPVDIAYARDINLLYWMSLPRGTTKICEMDRFMKNIMLYGEASVEDFMVSYKTRSKDGIERFYSKLEDARKEDDPFKDIALLEPPPGLKSFIEQLRVIQKESKINGDDDPAARAIESLEKLKHVGEKNI